ncbi:unnamed protein product [Polarella glacialis]|uniref:Cytochrome b561 domain-containing protein n=1 Tax=Polarella glacialis TaxID=89957 RepID=A0A813HV72_POLGL|nr:unnamed protein product [Polarella glacialis]CAE8642252.1 unnamed protein product [Polarella glacialis]
MKAALTSVTAAWWWASDSRVLAFPSFAEKIPNAERVADASGRLWPGVGHLSRNGGGQLNSFGQDFEAAGWAWTADLCQKDSDADGSSNGEELGDPNCTWQPGSVPAHSTGITHPGISNITGSYSAGADEEIGLFGAAPAWYLKHAALMLVSWVVIMPIGILVPVIFKDRSKGPMWFHAHKLLMILGLTFVLAGLSVALRNKSGKHFVSQHSLLGLASLVLAVLQPVNAFFRPRARSEKNIRQVWELCHRWLGRLAVLLAAGAAVTGIRTNLSSFISTSSADAGAAAVVVILTLWAVLIISVKLLPCLRKQADYDPYLHVVAGGTVIGKESACFTDVARGSQSTACQANRLKNPCCKVL